VVDPRPCSEPALPQNAKGSTALQESKEQQEEASAHIGRRQMDESEILPSEYHRLAQPVMCCLLAGPTIAGAPVVGWLSSGRWLGDVLLPVGRGVTLLLLSVVLGCVSASNACLSTWESDCAIGLLGTKACSSQRMELQSGF
jgi:hypothetical protein